MTPVGQRSKRLPEPPNDPPSLPARHDALEETGLGISHECVGSTCDSFLIIDAHLVE